MYYHASSHGNIKVLEPRISNHGIPLIYFSKKKENVLVYLSNAVEKYCKDTKFNYDGNWMKWGPYGFTKDGKLQIQEYYPNALENTYRGVAGYIYRVENIEDSGFEVQIPDAATSSFSVVVDGVEYVTDAYETIIEAENKGLIEVVRYEDISSKMKDWIVRTIPEEYKTAENHPEYRHFLKGMFADILNM
ncbi:hypothetical protein SAMN02745247_01886 [Butyrivibrio hungatei DSM 14810]|uniref:Uncharacterized protein n=1 Tax=Butyrivibrio hungatei DSM 14810 TaxID=1121132 RepID=A0A1M7SJD2_9FIRM|nr:hypothetical protein [Butyrivibrio hungatei]SHN58530.1 hypothetical protein SAMN02745247_01886 [Butyrivibrio hungatei DSM 14810]